MMELKDTDAKFLLVFMAGMAAKELYGFVQICIAKWRGLLFRILLIQIPLIKILRL